MHVWQLRRAVLLLGAIVTLALAPPALAQEATPEGCPGSVKTTNAAGGEAGMTNQNPYATTADVYVHGENFPSTLTAATYVIEDVNDNVVVKGPVTNGISPISAGAFHQAIWTAGERAGITGHEFKVTVTYLGANGQECRKSDNFFIVPSPFAAAVAAAPVATGGGQAIVPTTTCPRGITVRPRELVIGERTLVTITVRRNGQPVRHALVIITGAGVSKTDMTGPRGIARVWVTTTRRGVLRVFVPNVCVRRAGVLGAVAGGGVALTGRSVSSRSLGRR